MRDWHFENSVNKFRKDHFGRVFETALSKISKETIHNGFRSCGLCPFEVENIKFSKISTHLTKVNQDSKTNSTKVKECLTVLERYIPTEKLEAFSENFNAD